MWTASYSIVLTERSGLVTDPIEYVGTLTLARDANGRISGGQVTVTNAKGKVVTHALKSSGYSSSGYFYTVAQVDKTYFGLNATISGHVPQRLRLRRRGVQDQPVGAERYGLTWTTAVVRLGCPRRPGSWRSAASAPRAASGRPRA